MNARMKHWQPVSQVASSSGLKALHIRHWKDLLSCTNLESLGPNDVLKRLTSLKDLHIKHCPKVHSLPEEGVSTSLQHLVIEGCPTLAEQSRRDGGLDWPKIMHIPHIEIDSTQVSPSLDLSNQVQAHPKASSTRWYHHLMPRKVVKYLI
ncbi:hypothetical protein AAG906_006829 [Vitis piasezkii]